MKIFLICPVRNLTDEFKEKLERYVRVREGLHEDEVHYPPRDTDQVDPTGLRICTDNLTAMYFADEVHIAWDEKSEGCLFDLGIAFALKKKITPVPFLFPTETKTGKSFPNMIWALYKKSGRNP